MDAASTIRAIHQGSACLALVRSAGATFVGLLFLLVLTGCGSREIIEDKEVIRCARDIVQQLESSKQSLFKNTTGSSDTEFPATLYVDMSASMYGYSAESDSKFRQVLKAITSRLAKDLELRAIGTPRDGTSSSSHLEVRDALNQANYDRKDSDFGPVIRSFSEQPERIHLMLTDSVEWHPQTIEHYGDITRSANQFFKKGGRFALLIFRGSYKGAYSSVVLADRGRGQSGLPRTHYLVDYETDNRPFTLWAFLPPKASIDDITKHLKAHGIEPALPLDFRETDIIPELAHERIRESGQRRTQRILRDIQTVHSPDLRSFPKATVISSVTQDGYFPLQFDLACNAMLLKTVGGKHEALAQWLSENVIAELQCWELVRQPGGSFTNNRIRADSLDFQGPPEIRGSAMESEAAAPEAAKKARLIIKVRKPSGDSGKAKVYMWVLTLRLSKDGCGKLIPPEYTTNDDSTPEQRDRILNLAPMIGAVASGNYLLGRSIAVTEWR
jgi:hypothetical protein